MYASAQVREALAAAIVRMLRPLVRVLLAYGLSFKAFADLARRAYVDVALHEFRLPARKQTVSRVSILTGLSRKEVQRVLQDPEAYEAGASASYNRAVRVIAGWVRDRAFTDSHDRPIPLPLENGPNSFSSLVRRYSGDMPAKAVLDELLRVGAVERVDDDHVRLVSRAYVPRASEIDKLAILGTDVADLIGTIGHNLEYGAADPYFQRKVMYDNLPVEALAEFRGLSAERAQKLLERLDEWLATHDRDVTPQSTGTGRVRAGIGVYYFEEDLQTTPHERKHGRASDPE